MFLSIFAATCRPQNITGFLDNLAQTCNDPKSFEVLLKLDEGAKDMVAILENYKQTSPLQIKYLETETLDGYYSLEAGYNELLKIAHPDTYFCWLLTDEIRIETKGWDTLLQKYIGHYSDDIFRLKLSIFALKNYQDFFECLPCPDNYALTTRKWLEITGGWGNFWGPDSWHQCVDYYLGLCKNENDIFGVWRSCPIYDIKVGGQEAGQGIVDAKKLNERRKKIWYGWKKHSTHAAQENFNRLAQRLNAHIVAQSMHLDQYVLQEDVIEKSVSLFDIDKKTCYLTQKYALPKLNWRLFLANKKLKLVHIFDFLVIHRDKIDAILRFIKRVRRVLHKLFFMFSRMVNTITLKIAYLISFLLKLPAETAYACNYVLKKFIKIPESITMTIDAILRFPQRIAQKTYSRVHRVCCAVKHALLSDISMHNIKKLWRKSINPNARQEGLYSYVYDGKTLTMVEE